MQNGRKKNLIIVALLAVIAVAGIAYAALAQNLIITGTANVTDAEWNVAITKIQNTALVNSTEEQAPAFTSTTATFEVNLNAPGSYAEYDITVTNSGTIVAKLDSIDGVDTVNAAAPTDIVYTVTGVTEGSTTCAADGGTNVVHVKVEWLSTSTSVPAVKTKTATITLNYIQNA